MTENGVIYFDGEYLDAGERIFYLDNRSFRYGDGLFESIRIVNGNPQFLAKHIDRLHAGMRLFEYNFSRSVTKEYIQEKIRELLVRNEIDMGARIRLSVFRKNGGYYTPRSNDCSLVIEAHKLDQNLYELNAKGLLIDIYEDQKKTVNRLSSIKSSNAIVYVLAGIFKQRNMLNDCVLENDKGNLVETINSNIFAAKNGVLYTPPVEEGCVDGVMRKKVIEVAKKNRISTYEIELKRNVLLNSDEVFITNTIKGIQWVGAYKNKRFYNNLSKKLTDLLNDSIVSSD